MPNNNEICQACGYAKELHRYDTMQCPDGGEAREGLYQKWLSTTFTTDYAVPASFIEKVRALCAEADEYDVSLCNACKRLNPQHAECTSCNDRDDLIKALAAVRDELKRIEGK